MALSLRTGTTTFSVIALVGLTLSQLAATAPLSPDTNGLSTPLEASKKKDVVVVVVNVNNGVKTNDVTSGALPLARQDFEDDEDDGGDDEGSSGGSGEDDEERRRRVSASVGQILLGAFSLDPNRILKGAFGFAEKDVQDNILNVILGQKPPTKAATTPEPNEEESQVTAGTSGPQSNKPTPANNKNNANKPNESPIKSPEKAINKQQEKSVERSKNIITFAAKSTEAPKTTKASRRTTKYESDDDEEADSRF